MNKFTKQQIRDLNDPPRNARRNDVAVPPAKATRCNHTYRDVRDEYGTPLLLCLSCGHIRGERTGRGFR
jgi:hypothetical protein